MSETLADSILAIGQEIAGTITGAGDTGIGAGEYEVFVGRGDYEFRVTVSPYWNNKTDEPIGEPSDPQVEAAYDALEDALVTGFAGNNDGPTWEQIAPLMDVARTLLMLHRGVDPSTVGQPQ